MVVPELAASFWMTLLSPPESDDCDEPPPDEPDEPDEPDHDDET